MTDHAHGSAHAYRYHGCRCDTCTDAMKAKWAKYNALRRGEAPPPPPAPDTTWQERAGCAFDGNSTWWDTWPTKPTLGEAAAARAICARCPVATECLATYKAEPQGIFAGLDEHQRGVSRRQFRAPRRVAS